VRAPVQYGPRVRATAVCLTHQHLLPYNRAHAVLGDLLGCALSTGTLAAWLRAAYRRVVRARASGQTPLPERTRAAIYQRCGRLLAQGWAANPPLREALPRRRGRPKHNKAQNLLGRLGDTAAGLAFVDNLTLPFDNNRAERDVRMVKVQQKASGMFRSVAGARAFARIRSYFSTLRKQGLPVYAASLSLFRGQPLLPALT